MSPYWSPFRGWLNDLRIFDRGLAAYEVAGLVRGNGAVLALSFEDQPLAGRKIAQGLDRERATPGRLYTDEAGSKAARRPGRRAVPGAGWRRRLLSSLRQISGWT